MEELLRALSRDAPAADELQYERGYRPCLDAGRGNVVLRVDDMRNEESIGALNVYSSVSDAFATPESLDAGLQVAEAIAVAVVNADPHAQLTEQARTMRVAMDSRAVIEQAEGVLMAQRHVDADQVFDILREASQRYNRKLRDIVGGIVASAQDQRPR